MLTHKQVQNLNRYWTKQNKLHKAYHPIPIIVKATSVDDNLRCALHMLNPTKTELLDKLHEAAYHGFEEIVIHTKRTFGKSRK